MQHGLIHFRLIVLPNKQWSVLFTRHSYSGEGGGSLCNLSLFYWQLSSSQTLKFK